MRRFLAGLLVWGLAAFAWFCFAPPALGGWTNYVTTDGVSMEPRFHGGDLVLVRSEKSYHVGEIVAYRSKTLGTVVLHRIVARDGARYVFKGDNNDFDDVGHPTKSQLIGALWIHIPAKYADVLSALREPPVLGGLVAFGSLLFGAGAFRRRRRRKRERRLQDAHTAPSGGIHRPAPAVVPGDVLIFGCGVLLASAAVAAVAFSRPVNALGPVSLPYAQTGTFSYSSSTASGPAYPGGRVVTGDPVFMRLVQDVNVRFAYSFSSTAQHQIVGSSSLDARIASSSGWSKTLVLQRPAPFTGDHAVLAGTLALGPLMTILHGLERTTEVGGTYNLSLVPHVSVSGEVGGVSTKATFSPSLPFTLGPLELQPILSSGATAPTQPAGGPSRSPLTPSASASVTGRALRPRELAFGPASISVATARLIALTGLALGTSLALGALAFVLRASRRRGDLASEILGRYRRGLITVARAPQASPSDLVELDDMETLVRIAERYDRMILHEPMKGADTFVVPEDGVLYRFAVPSEIHLKYPPRQPQFFAGRDAAPDRSEDTENDFTAAARRSRARLRPQVAERVEPGFVRWGPWTEPVPDLESPASARGA
jgi:signal peptidase I